MTVENNEGPSEALQNEARDMGWVPQDEWKGNPDEWRDAEEFVERGRSILPIVQATNKRLQSKLLTQDERIASLEASLEESRKAVAAIQKGYTEATKREVEKAKVELRQQLIAARDAGDIDAELEIQDQISNLKEVGKQAKEDNENQGNPDPKPKQGELHPDYVAWQRENPWFGDDKNPNYDRKRTKALVRIAEDLREDGDTTVGREFMDKAMDILLKQEGKSSNSSRSTSKVEGGTHGGSPNSGRPFLSLSKEAKDICHDQSSDFVGPGKMFKTEKEWEDHYAELVLNFGGE